MDYKLIWHEKALKDLKKKDKEKARQIISRVKTCLRASPETLGKQLKGEFKGLYRYRFGDYRIVYTINKTEKTLSILVIDHRKKVYSKKWFNLYFTFFQLFIS